MMRPYFFRRREKKQLRYFFYVLLLSVFVFSQLYSVAGALDPKQKTLFNEGIYYYNVATCGANGGGANSDTSIAGKTTKPPEEVQKVVWNTLTANGIDPMHTAAVMGNIAHEGVWDPMNIEDITGLKDNTDPSVADPYGYGLIGWTPGSSLLAQMNEAGIKGPPYTAETQAAVLVAQIQGKTPAYYTPDLGRQFLNTKSIDDATTAYQGNANIGGPYLGFERPADESGSLSERIASAKYFLQKFGGTTGTVASPGGGNGMGATCTCPSNSNDTPGTVVSANDANLVGKTNAEKAFNYYISQRGLSANAAAGLVGNFMSESGGNTENLQPAVTNSIGAHGIAQWLGGRRAALEQFANKNNEPVDSLATQLDFSWSELTGSYKSVLNEIKKASSAADAADIVNSKYEVSGVAPTTREANAKRLIAKYGDGTASTTAATDANCPQSNTMSGSCDVTQPLYTDVLSVEQLTQIYGNPGTASSHPQMDANLTTVDFLGNSVQVNKLVAPCLQAVAQQIQSENVNYKITEMGCYRFDSNNGSSNIGLMSYHTYGAACDINWDSNPFVSGGTAPHDMPEAYVKAFNDHGFYWGGDFNSVKDYMHFEFHGIKPQ